MSKVALAVEDDPQVLRLVVRSLRSMGLQILAAHSREEAEQVLQNSEGVDLLVTDIFLGDGWGGELAFRLREENPSLAVVFMSGRAGDDPILRHGIQEHMVFLEKPFTVVDLTNAARRALESVPDLSPD